MVRLLYIIIINLMCSSYAYPFFNDEITKPTELEHFKRSSIAISYINLMSGDSQFSNASWRKSDGVKVSYINRKYRTIISGFFTHGSLESEYSEIKPVEVAVAGDAAIENISFDLDISIGKLEYKSKEKTNVYDIGVMGEYQLLRKLMEFKEQHRMEASHEFYATVGSAIKLDLNTKTKTHEIYLDGEKLDSIENPLSDSKSSGIEFFASSGVYYRVSLLNFGISANMCLPHINKSFFIFSVGGSF